MSAADVEYELVKVLKALQSGITVNVQSYPHQGKTEIKIKLG